MSRANRNIGPVGLSVLLHVMIFASMIIGFDYARPTQFTPLAVKATLVQEVPEQKPPPPVVEPEPEPEPEPVIEEPEPEPEPDNSAELRRLAEEEKRRQDALLEQQRLEELKRKEEERIQKEREEAERKRREEAERKKREEEELERKREEAERKRQEDIRRQQEENERLRREQLAAELEAEERRFAARSSAEMAAYQFAIAQKVRRSWAVPGSAGPETKCTVRVTQLPGGVVADVNIISCNGDEAVRRSVEAAIRRASPLPEPSDPDLFDRNLTLNLTLERDD